MLRTDTVVENAQNNGNLVERREAKAENVNFAFTYSSTESNPLSCFEVFKQFLQFNKNKGFIGIYSISTGSFICQRLSGEQNKQEVINGLRSTFIGSEVGSFIFGGSVGKSLYYLNENGAAMTFNFDNQTFTFKQKGSVITATSYSHSEIGSLDYTCAILSLTSLNSLINGLVDGDSSVEEQHNNYVKQVRSNRKQHNKLLINFNEDGLRKLRARVLVASDVLVKKTSKDYYDQMLSMQPNQGCIGVANVGNSDLLTFIFETDWAKNTYIKDFFTRQKITPELMEGYFLFEVTPATDNHRIVALLDENGQRVQTYHDHKTSESPINADIYTLTLSLVINKNAALEDKPQNFILQTNEGLMGVTSDLSQAKETFNKLTQERDSATASETAKAAELEKNLQDMQAEKDCLTQQIDQVKLTLETAQSEKLLETQRADMLSSNLQEVRSQKEMEENKVLTLEINLQTVQAELAIRLERFKQVKSTLETTQLQNQQQTQRADELASDLQTVRAELDARNQQIAETKATLATTQSQKQEETQRADELASDLQTVRAELETSNQALQQTELSLYAMESQKQQQTQRANELERTLQDVRTEKAALDKTIANWTGLLKVLTFGGVTLSLSLLLMADAAKWAAIAGVSSAVVPVLVPIAVGGALLGGIFFARKCLSPSDPPAPDVRTAQQNVR